MAAPHLPWVEETRGKVAGLDLLPLLALLPPDGYIPDFLTPPPASPLERIEDELERIRATPVPQVRKELAIFKRQHGGLPTAAEPLRRRTEAELPRLVDAMEAYWHRAVASHWPRILALLSADLRHRATRLTEGGAGSLFNDLHPALSFDGEWLHIEQPWQGTVELGGDGLLLVPTAFNWHRPSVIAGVEPWQPTVIYPARGVALLWEPAEADPGIAALIGAGKARILAALDAPASTTELAARIGMTPGGISQHLATLTRSGVVTKRREGRTVLYARTARGDALAHC